MVAPYGFCAKCGAGGVSRERRINGNDRCAGNHFYPSSTATKRPEALVRRLSTPKVTTYTNLYLNKGGAIWQGASYTSREEADRARDEIRRAGMGRRIALAISK